MKRSPLPAASPDRWKELYIAALFENDKSKIAERIERAQVAIVARRQESFVPGNRTQERQVLDTALLSLQALASCLSISQPRAAEQARAA